MAVQITKDGATVSESRNLAGILRYASKHYVDEIHIKAETLKPKAGGKGFLRVVFEDGAEAETEFGSYRVLMNWIGSRQGNWRGALLHANESYVGELDKGTAKVLRLLSLEGQQG